MALESASQDCNRLTVAQMVEAIARLGDHGGARYTDIRKALGEKGDEPSFFQVKATLLRASKEGAVFQTSGGRWVLPHAKESGKARIPAASSTRLYRRRRGRRGRSRRGRRRTRRGRRRRGRRRRKRSRSDRRYNTKGCRGGRRRGGGKRRGRRRRRGGRRRRGKR